MGTAFQWVSLPSPSTQALKISLQSSILSFVLGFWKEFKVNYKRGEFIGNALIKIM